MAKNQPRKQPAEELQPEQPQDSGTQSGNPSRILENLDAELHQLEEEHEQDLHQLTILKAKKKRDEIHQQIKYLTQEEHQPNKNKEQSNR